MRRAIAAVVVTGLVLLGILWVGSISAEAQMMMMHGKSPGGTPTPTPMPQNPNRTFLFFVEPGMMMSGYTPQMSYYPQMSYSSSGYGSQSPYGSSGAYGSSYDAVPPYLYAKKGSGSGKQEDADVLIHDNYFQPAEMTVKPGTSVRWKDGSRNYHTVSSDKGDWGSGLMGEDEIYGHTFTVPGTYRYHCKIHAKEMTGVVIVK
jgi:plastocyanin